MIFSTKVVAQFVTNVLTLAVGVVIARFGFHASPELVAAIPGTISLASGAFAGWFVREEGSLSPSLDHLEARVQAVYDKLPGPVRLDLQAAAVAVQATPEVQTVEQDLGAIVKGEVTALLAKLKALGVDPTDFVAQVTSAVNADVPPPAAP